MSGEVLIALTFLDNDHVESSIIIKKCNKSEFTNLVESLLTEPR